MSYIGNDLQVAYSTYRTIDDISGSFNGSTTSFALLVGGVAPVPLPLNSQQCLISVGGVIQRPDDTGAEGFRLSGGNIVFSSAPGTGEDFFGVILAGADYVNVGANFPSGSAAVPSITFDSDLDTGIYNSAANQVSITTSGTERLRVDSGGQIEAVSLGTAAAPTWSFTTDANTGIYSPGADTVAISTSGAQRVTVDSSGRVGINTSAPAYALDVASSDTTAGIGYALRLRQNATAGAAAIQFTDNPVTNQYGYIACDSSSNIKFATGLTEKARLDSSGRLLVGTSTARVGVKLEVEAADSTAAFSASRTSNDGGGPLFYFAKTRGSSVVQSGDALGYMSFLGYDGSALREGASIVAVVDGTPGANDMPGRLVFSVTRDGQASPTQAMLINSGGNIGCFASVDCFNVSSATGAGTSNILYRGHHSASGVFGGTISFQVFTNGNTQNSNNSYGAISDLKLKENIVLASSQWNDIKALQVRKYNFKAGTGQPTHTQIGLIAQEVEEVSPGLVYESPDLDAENSDLGTVTKSVNYSVLYMKAVKALQEAMERIEQLETEMAAVKAQLA